MSKDITEKNRLVYIDPNEYAGLLAKENNPDLENSTMLSWNPEELSMSVDLQVIIPRRADAGQISYRVNVDGSDISFNGGLSNRYVSYLGGTEYDNTKESFLTDDFLNISYQEVFNDKVVDKESLGINSIDISFDSHFFPIVNIHFTDVRGASLFMPMEQEFYQSVTDKKDVKQTTSSFFKALFHFPYPRFLLSVKGFYGTKVTFQLAVSDFKSNFQPETGNYDITVQFIGYVYGLYTDLPFNLIMAAPYFNSEYWQDKKSSGVFRYVDNGQAGGEMLTYVEFLSKMEAKKIDKDSLVSANETKNYLKTKEAIKALKEIPELYRKACFSTPVKENGTTYYYTKRSSAVQTFIWGLKTHKKNDENNVTNENDGFHFNEEASLELYKALQKIYTDFPEYKDLVNTNNIFIESWNNKKINGKNLNSDTIANDKDLKYATLFSYVKPKDTKTLDNFFEFYDNGATIEGKKIDGNFYIKDNNTFKGLIGNDDTEFQNTFVTFNPNNSLMLAGGPDYLTVITNTKDDEGKLKYNPKNTYGVIVKVEDYCAGISAQIVQLEDDLKTLQTKVADELKEVYKNVIGFEPTVENYYRMLFAHIDCFMNYYTGKVLKEVSDDYNKQKRTLKELGITVDDTDLPKEFKKGDTNEISVYPFPAYYTKSSQRMSSKIVADYPGYASGEHANFANIPEVKAVDNILKGIETLKVEYEVAVGGSGTVLTENIFSPLSILYNFQNPWNTLDIKRINDEKDILKIIYFYMSLLYADKVIGTNTDRSDMKDVTPYKKQLASLLMDKIGGNVTSTFIDSLSQMINRVNEPNGLNYIIDNIKNDYHLNNFKSSGNDIFVYNKTKNGGNGLTVFKVDNDVLKKEASTLDYDKYYITGGGNGGDKNRIISFSSEGFLKEYDNTQLKNFNNSLIKIGEGSEYLSDRDGKIVLGDYCTSLLLEKPYTKKYNGIDRPFVGINCDGNILLQKRGGEILTSGASQITRDLSGNLIDTNKKTYDTLLETFKNGNSDKHMNFIGRKQSGVTKFKISETVITKTTNNQDDIREIETGTECIKDKYTAVNIFSGIHEETIGNNKITSTIDLTANKVTIEYPKTAQYSSNDLDSILPLLYSKRCGGSTVTYYETQDKNRVKAEFIKNTIEDEHKYALATYFLGGICGPSSLRNIVNRFVDNYSTNKKSYAIRKVELLYLAGSLYFTKNNLNIWDEGNRHIICDVICNDGTLGHGLLKEDIVKDKNGNVIDKYNTNESGIDVNTLFFEDVADKLIEYFEDWCNTELFGGKNMYGQLSQVSNVDDSNYLRMNGFFDNTDCFSIIQGYTTGGECEKWLTDLVCSYEFVMTFYSNFNTATGTTITKKEITDFLSYIYDDLKKQKDDREERVRAFEEGRSTSIGEDLRRATYYLLKNLYDKWLCTYTAKEFELHDPVVDLNMRKERYSGLKLDMPNYSEYNNFIYIDQFYRDISSSYLLDSDLMAKTIKDIYKGRSNMDIYTLMSYMAEKNNLMLLALPVYTNMYNAENVRRVFTPNTLYGANGGDNCNGVGTTYVVMHTSEPSHNPGEFGSYDYSGDYIDIADLNNNNGPVDLELFGKTNNTNASDLDYTVTAFGVEYSKQNQMYFKRVNVNMDNPKITNEAIKNMFILADGGSQGTTDQPIAIGQNIYSIYANRSYTCTVEMLGCMNIMPMMYFNLNNVPMFRGLYMIINVKHSIKAGDITTTFTGVRVNRYALPDVTDMMLNSSLFDSIAENRDSWKDGKAISNCEEKHSECPNISEEELDKVIEGTHYTLRELIKTGTKTKQECYKYPNDEQKKNIIKLAQEYIELIYQAWLAKTGDKMIVTSCFRSPYVNCAVGGSETSLHLSGCAFDSQPGKIGLINEYIQFIKCWLWNGGKNFQEFIDEKKGESHWAHLGYSNSKNDKWIKSTNNNARVIEKHHISQSDCQQNT